MWLEQFPEVPRLTDSMLKVPGTLALTRPCKLSIHISLESLSLFVVAGRTDRCSSYTDGGIIREGVQGESPEGDYSTGVRLQSLDPNELRILTFFSAAAPVT